MTVLKAHVFEPDESFLLRQLGRSFEKHADVLLSGLLQLTRERALALAVPASLVRGVFDALHEPGVTLPTYDTSPAVVRANVLVMTAKEVEEVGGAATIVERGRSFKYRLRELVELPAKNWPGVTRCWHLRVDSPELSQLRVSYGLSRKLNNNQDDFSVVVAYRKAGVLAGNAVTRTASSWLELLKSRVIPPWVGTSKKPVS
jgi:hypothetical protein